MILEFGRIEMPGLRLDDMSGKLAHLRRQLDVGDILEIGVLFAYLVGIAQGHAEQPALERLQHYHALPARQHDPSERHHVEVADGIPDHGERLLPDLVGRSQIIGVLQIALIDLGLGHELIDIDGVSALDLDLLDFLVVDLDVLAFADLVAATHLLPRDRLAGLRIHHLLANTIAGLLVDAAKRYALRSRGSRIERDRTRNQRKLEITLPISSRRHRELLPLHARQSPGAENIEPRPLATGVTGPPRRTLMSGIALTSRGSTRFPTAAVRPRAAGQVRAIYRTFIAGGRPDGDSATIG